MKKYILLTVLSIFLTTIGLFPNTTNGTTIPIKNIGGILTTSSTDIINPPGDYAIQQGTKNAVGGQGDDKQYTYEISNLISGDEYITNHSDAKLSTIRAIRRLINRGLGITSLIALIILLIAGFQMVTANGDDAKYKAGGKALKKVTIALVGIGISRFLISFIYRLISLVTQAQ